jgi:hypothetical protein
MSGWQPPQYDPRQHQERISGPQSPQYAPQPPWLQPGHGQPSKRKSHKLIIMLGIIGGLALGLALIGGVASVLRSPSGVHAQAAAQAPAAKVTPEVVARYRGAGILNTPRFTVGATWELEWSYNCGNGPGVFVIMEDGGNDMAAYTGGDGGTTQSSSTWVYDDAGTHYLEIDTGCAWTVKVINQS